MKKEMNRRLFLLTVILIVCSSESAQETRLAFLRLNGKGVSDAEVQVMSNLIIDNIVNLQMYTVLEREQIEKILQENAIGSEEGYQKDQLKKAGQLLNADKIVTGTLMRMQGLYFLDVRIVDVSTLSIERSRTESWENENFISVAHRVANFLCNVTREESDQQPVVTFESQKISQPNESKVNIPPEWDKARFSIYDYNRFSKSGVSLDRWIQDEYRTPAIAAMMGAIPFVSGFYYTRKIGFGVFMTLADCMAVTGMLRHIQRGGEHDIELQLYAGLLLVSSVIDGVGSAYSAAGYNRSLNMLQSINKVSICIGHDSFKTSFSFQF